MRTARNEARIPWRMKWVMTSSGGTTRKVISASGQFSSSSATAMPTMVTASLRIANPPEVSSSLRASTSFVRRVMSRPTGWRSKKLSDRRWMCANSATRRSCMARWPAAFSR